MTPPNDATALLCSMKTGDTNAADRLLPKVCSELRRTAERQLSSGRAARLHPTALIDEAYLRLVDSDEPDPSDKPPYLRVAAKALRRVLVESAQRRAQAQLGGGGKREAIEGLLAHYERPGFDLAGLDDALEQLATHDETLSSVVELRFFAGLTDEESAEALGLPLSTVERSWVSARAWLQTEIESS